MAKKPAHSTKTRNAKARVTIGRGAKTNSERSLRRPSKSLDPNRAALREQIAELLRWGGAHVKFEEAVARFPANMRGIRFQGLPFSAWELLEHIRIAQWDILEFSRNPKHVSPAWPSGYWPATSNPPSGGAWDRSVKAVRANLQAMERLIVNHASDLFAPIPHGDGQTLLREALLVADHNAYHIGQMVAIRRLLGIWNE